MADLILVDGKGDIIVAGSKVHSHDIEGHCGQDMEVMAVYPSLKKLLVNEGGSRHCLDPMFVACMFVTPEMHAAAVKVIADNNNRGKHPWKH